MPLAFASPPHFSRAAALVFLVAAVPVLAAPADPLGTEALLPPRPPLAAADGSFTPCAAPTGEAASSVIGVVDVIDQALCRNPKTFELWASARNQAALLGVAESAFLPGLDASGTFNRNLGKDQNTTTRSASMTLSWLLLDFGTRSANQ